MSRDLPSFREEIDKLDQKEEQDKRELKELAARADARKPRWAQKEIVDNVRTPEEGAELMNTKCCDIVAEGRRRLQDFGYWMVEDIPGSDLSSNRRVEQVLNVLNVQNPHTIDILRQLNDTQKRAAVNALLETFLKIDVRSPVNLIRDNDIADAVNEVHSLSRRTLRFNAVTRFGVNLLDSQHVYRTSIPGLFLVEESYRHVQLTSDGGSNTIYERRRTLSMCFTKDNESGKISLLE